MVLNKFMEKFADEVGGQYSEYDVNKSVVIVPLLHNRFQAVMAIEKSENGRSIYQFTSKVCGYHPNIDLKEMLKSNINFHYSKFYIEDEVIRMVASTEKGVGEEVLKEIIMEVAGSADEWENKLTGLDVN